VTAWNQRITDAGLGNEQAVRAWLADRGANGYAQAPLVWERFGYPDFLIADADELISGVVIEGSGLPGPAWSVERAP
jgi:hypothetical protein